MIHHMGHREHWRISLDKIDEYKDKINWDIWEDVVTDYWGIHTPEGNAEEKPHENPNIPIKDHIIKKV